ncbi:hypothetical protein NXS15_02635 [Mycoplasma sp. CSL7475-4]|uniref:OppA family ABC transporter substrate-binding lipoprotein n=1 Tax=Mycoplasma sp. CSL7475-4 TaxID=2973942 RepID=UPI00216AED5B|nr:hypothetical protein [Mycoplasma sp. CSL7475-4]MCS4537009.1 hypothetical protein [Mycoplasma sp. CSL7475-4]
MKFKLKSKLWLLPLTTTLATPLAVVACGNTGNQNNGTNGVQNTQGVATDSEYVKQGVIRSGVNSTYIPREFSQDSSNAYGSWQQQPEDQNAALLIRKSTTDKAEILETADPNTGAVSYQIKKPSVWRYKLELASKIIVTTVDGEVVEFDKDDAVLTEQPTNGNYSFAVYQGFSNDDRSINSKKFFDTLAKSTKLQFEIKDNVKWVDNNGNETKYNVVASDFYISWMRTRLLGVAERKKVANGTDVNVTELDQLITGILSSGSNYFSEQMRYPNLYLYGLFEVDANKLDDENETVQDGKLTFHKLSGKDSADFSALIENLATSQDFAAAPSQYIADKAKDGLPTLEPFSTENAATFSMEKISAIPRDNILSRAGVYWYGINDKYNLYAGAFYYGGYDKSTQEEKWLQNKHYVDQKWVNSPTAVKQFVLRYKGQGDDQQFSAVLWDDFKRGRISRLSYSTIPTAQQTEVIKAPQNFGVNYSQSLNKSSILSTQGWNLLPAVTDIESDSLNNPATLKAIVDSISYNDTFSRLVYGKTVEEMVKSQFKGDDIYNLFSGNGVIFRSLISAAVNYDHVASFVTDGKSKMYIAGLAPDANIGGSDQINSQTKTLRDVYQDVNSISYLNSNYTKANYTTPQEFADNWLIAGSDLDKLKSPEFEKIKAEMKKFLDANNVGADEKVKWQLTFRYVNWSPQKMQLIYNQLPDLFKELDPRLELTTTIYTAEQAALFYNQHVYGRSPYKIGGWGYDVNSMGSGVDGLANLYNFAIPSIMLGQELPQDASQSAKDNQNKFKAAFPAIFKLSQEFNKWVQEQLNNNVFTLSIGLDKFRNLTLSELDKISNSLSHYKYDEATQKLVENTDIKDTDVDLTTLTSRFFTTYTKTLTNQQNIDLAKELVLFIGNSVGRSKLISLEGFSPVLINPNYVFPFVGAEEEWYSDTKVLQNTDK